MDLVSRAEWNARAPLGDYTQLELVKGVKVHYTGGKVDPGITADHDGCVSLVRSIQAYHMDVNGWVDIGYCVDEQTEILTRDGWKTYRELRAGDIALTLDHVTGLSRWQPVLEVCVFPARRRQMVRMDGPGHSSLTTAHHRWPVERPWRAGAERLWVTTETIAPGDRIQVAAPCADLPAEPKWSDAFVELVAWRSAERTSEGRALSPRVRAALHSLLGPSGSAAALHDVLGPSGSAEAGGGHAELPASVAGELNAASPGGVPGHPFLLALTRAQLALFVETSLAAAGRAAFARKEVAEAFMFAVLLSGSGASLRHDTGTGLWQVTTRRRHHVTPRPAARDATAAVGPRPAAGHATGAVTIREEPYDGEIWCPRTPDQSWLARRDGTVYFTGNTAVACPHRKVFEGRWLHHLPAANGPGLNSHHYAVLGLVGESGLVTPPDGLLHGILDAVDHLREDGFAGKEIKGHRDGYATECPGGPLYAWVRHGAPRPG